MSRVPHLYVALSGHGFGHLAQIGPVLNAWHQRWPRARLTVQSLLPASVLRQRIAGELTVITGGADFGMVMADALTVQVAESLAAYRAFHAEWESRLAWQQALLAAARPDGVLADIPYLTLAAAARLAIPALALCSLNWADILAGYCANAPDLAALRAPMLAAYNSADAFLQPAPSMPMPDLGNGHTIGPIAAPGRDRRAMIKRRLGWEDAQTLIVLGLGGVALRPPLETWPELRGVRWLTPPDWRVSRADMASWDRLTDCTMLDLVRSCDVLLTKPGYGAFTEAVCNGTRVLYVARDDWPEEPWLSQWLVQHGNGVKIERKHLNSGDFTGALEALFAQPKRPALPPGGIAEAADWLDRLLALG